MTKRHWAHIGAAAAVAAVLAATAPAAAGSPDVSGAGAKSGATAPSVRRAADVPSATATAYLQARAAALTADDPAAALAPYLVAGSSLAAREARLATGMVLRGADLDRTVDSAVCKVTILDVQPGDDGVTASVGARAVTMITWRSSTGKTDTEGSGIDHTITLTRSGERWLVSADSYADDQRAACLEAAGASRAQVRSAARAVERRAPSLRLPSAQPGLTALSARGYTDILRYDRPAAQAYADTYCLSYNPTYVRFSGADCANFASQCGRAGGMPPQSGGTTSGWWYDKDGSSGPGDDTYSLSWINVTRQIGFWNARRTDWESSAGVLSRGDFIYYDWSGDGVWDHVAVVAGTNSAGQKVIDAHTTDHYRAYWKLGYSGTKYRFAKTRVSWVI
jgi:cell wall-associated NlpC family hydrolase